MTLNMLGIKTVPLTTTAQDGFLPSPELAATLISHKTRAIALVTPNNPVGHFLFTSYLFFRADLNFFPPRRVLYTPLVSLLLLPTLPRLTILPSSLTKPTETL